ncbi:hypothetical protein M8C21_016807, partial [Ambrosia artemisiifolia]
MMTDVQQQILQKPESTTDACLNFERRGSDFERGFEEVMRGRLDECMSFALCNAADDDDNVSESGRQAQEMISTIERRNRESELMALAGMQTVSMLDSSFLRESQPPSTNLRRQGNVERSSTRASTILQMWRELEEEHVLDRSRERVGVRLRPERSLDSSTNVSSTTEGGESENDYDQDNDGSSREQTPDIGEVEQERVRHIVQGWRETGVTDPAPDVAQRSGSRREEWLGETERERVRNVREWVQMTSQQRGTRGSREQSRERAGGQRDGQPEHVRRDMARLRGRQAIVDLLRKAERERRRELQDLTGYRAVSDFVHRNRIQSLLRGRFLRNERPVEEERPSVAASELVQLRQRHTVSGLREGFQSRSENIVHGQESEHDNQDQSQLWGQETDVHQVTDHIGSLDTVASIQNANQQENINEDQREDWQQESSSYSEFNIRRGGNLEDAGMNWQENSGNDWRQETLETGGDGAHMHGTDEVWREDASQEAIENWSNGASDPPRMLHLGAVGRVNRFHLPDDDSVYSMELRELLSRRSVSSLLRSDFRESLDQLIQSYINRQDRASIDWDLHRPSVSLEGEGDQEHHQDEQTEQSQQDAIGGRPSLVLPSPPVPPPQPLWHHFSYSSWSRHTMHRSEL